MCPEACPRSNLSFTIRAAKTYSVYVVALNMILQVSLLSKYFLALAAKPWLGRIKLPVVRDELGHQGLKF